MHKYNKINRFWNIYLCYCSCIDYLHALDDKNKHIGRCQLFVFTADCLPTSVFFAVKQKKQDKRFLFINRWKSFYKLLESDYVRCVLSGGWYSKIALSHSQGVLLQMTNSGDFWGTVYVRGHHSYSVLSGCYGGLKVCKQLFNFV